MNLMKPIRRAPTLKKILVKHPDYDQWKETLKSTDNNSLENCCKKVSKNPTEASNDQLGKRDVSIVSRKIIVNFEFPVASDIASNINIMDCVQDDGRINIPRHIFSQLEKSQVAQISSCDSKRKYNRNFDKKHHKKKSYYQVKARAIKLFEDFLETSKDREPGDDDKEAEETFTFQNRHKSDRR